MFKQLISFSHNHVSWINRSRPHKFQFFHLSITYTTNRSSRKPAKSDALCAPKVHFVTLLPRQVKVCKRGSLCVTFVSHAVPWVNSRPSQSNRVYLLLGQFNKATREHTQQYFHVLKSDPFFLVTV